MRQVKVLYIRNLTNGIEEMEGLINSTLKEISEKNGTVKNITYNSTDALGRVNSAIIEYDI